MSRSAPRAPGLLVRCAALGLALSLVACGGSGGGSGGSVPVSPSTPSDPPGPPVPGNPGNGGTPAPFTFPAVSGASPVGVVESAPIVITGTTAAVPISVQGGEYRIDSGSYTAADGTVPPGATVRVRVTAGSTEGQTVTAQVTIGGISATFSVATSGQRVLPTKTVGCPQTPCSEHDYPSLQALVNDLHAGDIVDVYASAQAYPAVRIDAQGTASKPILLRGVSIAGKRPVISGGLLKATGYSALDVRGATYFTMDGFEVTNGIHRLKADGTLDETPYVSEASGMKQCVRLEGEHVTLRNFYVHGCPNHGILGADEGNGVLHLDAVEVTSSGCYFANEAKLAKVCGNVKHPVYVATDPEIAGSRLRITNSFLHANVGGESIKSRAHRLELYHNWILTEGPQEVRALGAFGHDADVEASLQDPVLADIVGNVVVVNGHLPEVNSVFRLGGDRYLSANHADSYGRFRLVGNTIVVSGSLGTAANPLIRFYGRLEGLMAHNNVVHVADRTDGKVLLMLEPKDPDEQSWVATAAPAGKARVLLSHNHLPKDSLVLSGRDRQAPFGMEEAAPAGYAWSNWLQPDTRPFAGVVSNLSTLSAQQLRLAPGSPLRGAGTLDTNRARHPADPATPYAMPQAMGLPVNNAPQLSGSLFPSGAPRSDQGTPVLGAFD
jgi:hypothetical protein